jgi:hypothetical protein
VQALGGSRWGGAAAVLRHRRHLLLFRLEVGKNEQGKNEQGSLVCGKPLVAARKALSWLTSVRDDTLAWWFCVW